MLDNELACDIEFLVGSDSKSIKAHRYMLTSRSPVFFAMLCGDLAVSDNSSPVVVPDVTYEAFKIMLRFESWFLSVIE